MTCPVRIGHSICCGNLDLVTRLDEVVWSADQIIRKIVPCFLTAETILSILTIGIALVHLVIAEVVSELHRVGNDNLGDVVNDLNCVVELAESISGHAETVVIEAHVRHAFQRRIGGSDAAGRPPGRVKSQRRQSDTETSYRDSLQVYIPQINKANIIDGGIVDGCGQTKVRHLSETVQIGIKAGDVDGKVWIDLIIFVRKIIAEQSTEAGVGIHTIAALLSVRVWLKADV